MAAVRSLVASLVVFGAATALACAAGPMTAQQTLHNLIGSWSCTGHDSMHHTWRESDTYTMWGMWLRGDSSYPAQNGEPAGTGISLVRYDSHAGHWLIVGADTGGTAFTATSSSHAFDGSHWVDAYPADNGWANIHVNGMNAWTIDSSGPDGHGHTVVSHEVCTRR